MSFKRKVATLGGVSLLVAGALPGAVLGSSHREAPMIAKDPTADITDLYAFVSPDKPDTVTLIANYLPFQEPNGGPNFYPFDDQVLYWIKVDNTGDGEADITYNFQFKTQIADPETWLYNGNTITGSDFENLNVRQTYTLTQINGDTETVLGEDLPVPPANVGPRSTPKYDQLAAFAISEVGEGVSAFAGQRDDPFFADLGSIFDLGGLRPFNEFHLAPLDAAPGKDGLGAFNVNEIALQIPIKQLAEGGDVKENPVIGVYAGASRKNMDVLTGLPVEGAEWVQVSRLGNPLINEVVIPLGEKDEWNRDSPADDEEYEKYYLNPSLASIVNLVYPALPDARTSDRADLSLILLQGLALPDGTNVNQIDPENIVKADLLRLNMAVPPAKNPSRLGVLAGDLAGFPNGRRTWDDVVDIELRAVADGYGEFVNGIFGDVTPNKSPNNTVGDGCDSNDVAFKDSFPYLGTPNQGYDHPAHHQPCGAMPATDTVSAVASVTGVGSAVSR